MLSRNATSHSSSAIDRVLEQHCLQIAMASAISLARKSLCANSMLVRQNSGAQPHVGQQADNCEHGDPFNEH